MIWIILFLLHNKPSIVIGLFFRAESWMGRASEQTPQELSCAPFYQVNDIFFPVVL